MLSNKLYDILKWAAQLFLPALAALYFGLSEIWPLPYTQEIVGTIMAVVTFIGFIMGFSNIQYKQAKNTRAYQLPISGLEPQAVVPPMFPNISLPSNLYDSLKWVIQYLMPGLATLYLALSTIWNLPAGEQVVGTMSVLVTFLGVILGISNLQYKAQNQL